MSALDRTFFEEADRQLVVCNACRYCEGLCPVFHAIETRRDFAKGDVFYLANLCHDCRACYYACMFTPPHEFSINIPQLLSKARVESYARWSWPGWLAGGFKDPRVTLRLCGAMILLVMASAIALIGPARLFPGKLPDRQAGGTFYAIVPYAAMVIPAIVLLFYGAAVWWRGGARFWAETENASGERLTAGAFLEALWSILTLRHLGGGGPGCTYPDERPSATRRMYHAFVFWGFLADFTSTTLASIYQDLLHRFPPYPMTSAPVIFGTIGGVLLIAGVVGLLAIKQNSDRDPALPAAYGMDCVFLGALGLTAFTGMLTLIFRATQVVGVLLVTHLAVVAALFITAPYGKFVHAVYRSLALLWYYAERSSSSQSVG